jgi:hypothetical protein
MTRITGSGQERPFDVKPRPYLTGATLQGGHRFIHPAQCDQGCMQECASPDLSGAVNRWRLFSFAK